MHYAVSNLQNRVILWYNLLQPRITGYVIIHASYLYARTSHTHVANLMFLS